MYNINNRAGEDMYERSDNMATRAEILDWNVAKEHLTKRLYDFWEIRDVEKQIGDRLCASRFYETGLFAVYQLAFPDDKAREVSYYYITQALRKHWNVTETDLEVQLQENLAKMNFRFTEVNDLQHEIRRTHCAESVPNLQVHTDYKIIRVMCVNRLYHNSDVSFIFSEKFAENVKKILDNSCYVLIPAKNTVILLQDTVTDSELYEIRKMINYENVIKTEKRYRNMTLDACIYHYKNGELCIKLLDADDFENHERDVI